MKGRMLLIAMLVVVCACLACTGCDRDAPELSGIDKKVEIVCGTDFNLKAYLKDHVKIKDKTDDGTKDYELTDLKYSIKCDDRVYDDKTGAVDTGEAGTFDVKLTVKDEAGNSSDLDFKLEINPLKIEKGYYIYEGLGDKDTVLGFASFENLSKKTLKIEDIKVEYLDKNGTTLATGDMDTVEHTPEYIGKGETGYIYDAYSGDDIDNAKDVSKIVVSIDYKPADKSEDGTTLKVENVAIKRDYISNVSGFAGVATLTNPHDKEAEYYTFLVGMYDKNNKLIGVMDKMSDTKIRGKSKAKATAAWLPDSREIPNKVKSLKGSAYVTAYKGE